ncbi:hypothetical protein TEA_015830 [Camellia sinensis var. sinensis]|uniref:Uncharacterized protein n=1 Tax=Camellia sinensis var. sinensis TaxID=542762 RepID=A0A4S4E5J2_CAMSN|nr:hypothetical protein TEA_015830 [Camellia sinensis var. sinensis]
MDFVGSRLLCGQLGASFPCLLCLPDVWDIETTNQCDRYRLNFLDLIEELHDYTDLDGGLRTFSSKLLEFSLMQLLLGLCPSHDFCTADSMSKSKRKAIAKVVQIDTEGEVANQTVHLPIILPKLPRRFYYFFGKPIETEGRKQELKSREKAHELYVEVKSEVEKCIAFLKEKREHDPNRSILPRLIFQATHGFDSEVPTFEL